MPLWHRRDRVVSINQILSNNKIGKEYEKVFVYVGYHDDVWPNGNNIV